MQIQAAIQTVLEHKDLTSDQMIDVMRQIMTGQATPAQIGGFLVGLRMKGETVDEIAAAAGVMRGLSTKVEVDCDHLVDTCGTGGDGISTFNISTASAIVVAAAGGHVAKHGNRSVSSKSGSADVLEAAGVNLDCSPQQVARCIEEVGVGFMFAPMHHSAMKHAIGPRREMGIRTLFNLLGPLTNPADAPNQVLGVFARQWLVPIAEVLKQLGSQHVLVVHASDGMDEISISCNTHVAELVDGQISTYDINPEDYGIELSGLKKIAVDDAQESLDMIRSAFAGTKGPAADVIALNAGAAIYACDLETTLADGIARAQAVLADGSAQHRLDQLVEVSNRH